MLNIGGGEVLVILLLALIVLGPKRLPDAARQVGKAMGELRRISSGFQNELKQALDEPLEADARKRGAVYTPTTAVEAPTTEPTEPARPAKKAPAKQAAARKAAAARKRAAPLRAAGKPNGRSAS